MPTWLSVVIAVAIGFGIWKIGIASLRSFSPAEGVDEVPDEPEDVEDLDVFLVCGECGTEYKVSRLGELQIPRHCGERMLVVRRASDA